jgi:hypothetical protein
MIVYIDRQHAGKPNKIDDRGAGADIDGNGTKDTHEMEAHWTGYLALMLESKLMMMGYHVMPISDGTYSQRHERVNEYAKLFPGEKQIYLAMHLNAGGGDYCAMFYHHQSTSGKDLAIEICNGIQQFQPEITKYKQIAAQPTDWTEHAYNTIKGVQKPIAICSEPLFMDTHKHLISIEGFSKLALGIATGIKKWSEK